MNRRPSQAVSSPPAVGVCFQRIIDRVITFGHMVRFSHTVFALPFALSAVVLASRQMSFSWARLGWILVAMAGARSAAMGFNRIVDARYDAANPRTAGREIPAGRLSVAAAAAFVGIAALAFFTAAAALGRLCLILAPPVLAALFFYSYTKRFTALAHLYLGFAIGLAPTGAWIAMTNGFRPGVLLLSAGLMAYIAGFDILYSCQDIDFDRRAGLRSLPVRLGPRNAMRAAALLHALAWASFIGVWRAFGLGPVTLAAVAVIGALMIVEHRLVRPDDLSRINIAFFHINSMISVILFAGILVDVLFLRGA